MQKLSNNVVHQQNLAVLSAAVELVQEVVLRGLDREASATTLNDEFLTVAEIKETAASRIANYIGV